MKAGCVFCTIVAHAEPSFVVLEDDHVVAFLDREPLFHGHVLVATRSHIADLDALPDELIAPLFGAVLRISRAMPAALGADGSFVSVNTRVSQSVPHVHVHVVPRREGDGLFRAGMVWKRTRYAEGAAEPIAARLRAALARVR